MNNNDVKIIIGKDIKHIIDNIKNEDDFHAFMTLYPNYTEPKYYIETHSYHNTAYPLIYLLAISKNKKVLDFALKNKKQYKFDAFQNCTHYQNRKLISTPVIDEIIIKCTPSVFEKLKSAFPEIENSVTHFMGLLIQKGFINYKTLSHLFKTYPNIDILDIYKKEEIEKTKEMFPHIPVEKKMEYCRHFYLFDIFKKSLYKEKNNIISDFLSYFKLENELSYPYLFLILTSNMKHNDLFINSLKKYGYAQLSDALHSTLYKESREATRYYGINTNVQHCLVSIIKSSATDSISYNKIKYILENRLARNFYEADITLIKKFILTLNSEKKEITALLYDNNIQFSKNDIIFYSQLAIYVNDSAFIQFVFSEQKGILNSFTEEEHKKIVKNFLYQPEASINPSLFRLFIINGLPLYYSDTNVMQILLNRMLNSGYDKMLPATQTNFISAFKKLSSILRGFGMAYNRDISPGYAILNKGKKNLLTTAIELEVLNVTVQDSKTITKTKKRL